jgi:hypothetical protein
VKQNLRLEIVEVKTTIQGRNQGKITLHLFTIILPMEAITLPQDQHSMAVRVWTDQQLLPKTRQARKAKLYTAQAQRKIQIKKQDIDDK